MDHDRARGRLLGGSVIFCSTIFELELFRKLEVELDCCALERSVQRVPDGDVNLGTVESTIGRVEVPLSRVLGVEGLLELLENIGI